MTTRESLYDTWAPPASPWSPWAKPVLFSIMPVIPGGVDPTVPFPADWAPPADSSTALVLELPGWEGVALGLTLAGRGYRPVPLYNAVPCSTGPAAVDVLSIAKALQSGTDLLARCPLREAAPPCFLLDRNRRGSGSAPLPGWFDNRSVSFTTDFPSGSYLQSRGIRSVLLVQPAPQLLPDLSHTLRRWQETGLVIRLLIPGPGAVPQPLDVPKPGWFGFAWQRTLLAFGLRKNMTGGFGGWVPEPSSGAG